MEDERAESTPLGFTKLVVDDPDTVSTFYQKVCGIVEDGRFEDKVGGRTIQEVHFKSDPPGTGTFTLTKFFDAPKRSGPGVILGFVTKDIVSFVTRASDAGAEIIEAPRPRIEHGVKVAFLEDVEGNLIEVVELL